MVLTRNKEKAPSLTGTCRHAVAECIAQAEERAPALLTFGQEAAWPQAGCEAGEPGGSRFKGYESCLYANWFCDPSWFTFGANAG